MYTKKFLNIVAIFSSFSLLAVQQTEIIDAETYLQAAIEVCEDLKTSDVCSIVYQDEKRTGICVWDTDMDGKYVNACVI
jgi:hypothetical protein